MPITNDDKQVIEKALRETSDKRMYERCLAVLRDGLEGLTLGHSPGKPHRLSDEQENILADTIATKRPVDVGIEAKYTWTLKLAILFVERKFGKTFTERGMSPSAASARVQPYQGDLYNGAG